MRAPQSLLPAGGGPKATGENETEEQTKSARGTGIVMRDNRVFEGTRVQIVQAMQRIAFGVAHLSLSDYIDWVATKATALKE